MFSQKTLNKITGHVKRHIKYREREGAVSTRYIIVIK